MRIIKNLIKKQTTLGHEKDMFNVDKRFKDFEKVLKRRLPCDNIIRLVNSNDEVQYFLMQYLPATLVASMQDNYMIDCKFKQLTGENAGKIIKIESLNSKIFRKEEGKNCFRLSKSDKNKLDVKIGDYRNEQIETQNFTDLERKYGETISIEQLLKLWKSENGLARDINIEYDYEMVKNLYKSRNILKEETETLSK